MLRGFQFQPPCPTQGDSAEGELELAAGRTDVGKQIQRVGDSVPGYPTPGPLSRVGRGLWLGLEPRMACVGKR